MRELRSIEDAIALIDEWRVAFHELERHCSQLDNAWWKKYYALDLERHRLQAEIYDQVLAEATVRIANEELESP